MSPVCIKDSLCCSEWGDNGRMICKAGVFSFMQSLSNRGVYIAYWECYNEYVGNNGFTQGSVGVHHSD